MSDDGIYSYSTVHTFFYPTEYSLERLCSHLVDEHFKTVHLIGSDSLHNHIACTLHKHGMDVTSQQTGSCCSLLIPPIIDRGLRPSADAIKRALSTVGARPLFVFAPFEQMMTDADRYQIDPFATVMYTASEKALAVDRRFDRTREYFTIPPRRMAWICYNTLVSHRVDRYDSQHIAAAVADSYMTLRYMPVNTCD